MFDILLIVNLCYSPIVGWESRWVSVGIGRGIRALPLRMIADPLP